MLIYPIGLVIAAAAVFQSDARFREDKTVFERLL